MNSLVESFREHFASASHEEKESAKTAQFALRNVDWSMGLIEHRPSRQSVVDKHLEDACACSGISGSTTRKVAESLLTTSDGLQWRASSKNPDDGPDVVVFSRNCSVATVIGPGGLLPSDKISAGLSLQGPDIYYPPHAHRAEETYWVIGGAGDWRVDTQAWFAVEAGDSIYHAPWARHAMQTNERPMLSLWLWTSHLESEVRIIRG